jgi:hypothetical protein
MNRELLQQALDALKYHTEHTYPFHLTNVAIEALQKALSKPEQEPVAWRCTSPPCRCYDASDAKHCAYGYTAPPRKPWVGLSSEDWENTPDTGKQGCERDAELFDWIEQTLKDKNT